MKKSSFSIFAGLSVLIVVGAAAYLWASPQVSAEEGDFPLVRTEAEWRSMLSAQEYRVMREEGTERPFSSPLDANRETGVYVCRGSGAPLFSSREKFDSGTGWPSFYQPVASGLVGERQDRRFGMTRIEVHCAICGSHLGHVFSDGPAPTGLRYCINGVSLEFIALPDQAAINAFVEEWWQTQEYLDR